MVKEGLAVDLVDRVGGIPSALRVFKKRQLRIVNVVGATIEGKVAVINIGGTYKMKRHDVVYDSKDIREMYVLNPKRGDEEMARADYRGF